MALLPRIYSDDQREAIERAWGERMLRPAAKIVALAAAGELEVNGELVPAFHVPEQTVRDLGRRYLNRRAGLVKSALADLEPRDAVETLRRRLVAAADHELMACERQRARRKPVEPQRIQQLAKAVREIAAIPTREQQAPVHPRAKDARSSGLAGQILRAARTVPVHDALHPVEQESAPAAGLAENGAADHV